MKNYDKRVKFSSKIDFIIGDCGTGKTTLACKMLMKYKKKGYPCYSNVYMHGVRKFTLDDVMTYDFEDGAVIVLDEGATYGLASRGNEYKKNNSSDIIEFFTMYRHYKIERIIIISPSFQDIIPVVRSRVTEITVTKHSILFTLLLLPINLPLILFNKTPITINCCKYIMKKIDIIGAKEGGASEPKEVYKWTPLKIRYFCLNPYFKYFDSYCRKSLLPKDWEYWE